MWALSGGSRIHWGSFPSFVRAPEVVGFILVIFVNSGTHTGLSCLFVIFKLIPASPMGRRVLSGAVLWWFVSFAFA